LPVIRNRFYDSGRKPPGLKNGGLENSANNIVIRNDFHGFLMTYIPTESDVESTRNIINGQVVWAIPTIGCVLLIMHDLKGYHTWMKSNPTDIETENYEKVETNLLVLGYRELSAQIIGEATNVNDVLIILRTVVKNVKQGNELDDFWSSVDDSVSRMLDGLGL